MVDLLLIANPVVPLLEDQAVGKTLAYGFKCEVEVQLLDEPGGFAIMGKAQILVLS